MYINYELYGWFFYLLSIDEGDGRPGKEFDVVMEDEGGLDEPSTLIEGGSGWVDDDAGGVVTTGEADWALRDLIEPAELEVGRVDLLDPPVMEAGRGRVLPTDDKEWACMEIV